MEKIWLKQYPQGAPTEIKADAYPSVIEIFKESVAKYHDRPAFANLGQQFTYGELAEASNAFASYLQHDCQLAKGTRIAIMLPNLLQYPIALYGSLQAGMVVVNVNPLYTQHELAHQLQDSGAEVIIVLANFAHVLEKALAQTQIKHIIVTEIGDCLSSFKRVLANTVVKYIKKMVPPFNLPQAVNFREILEKGRQQAPQVVNLVPEDLAFLQYTGGTTDVAKGAMLTHGNMVANMMQTTAWIHPVVKPGEEIIITALPLYHIFSLMANCFTFMRCGALNVLITNPRDIPGFVKEISKYPSTAITGVNTLFNALLHNADFVTLDFSSLRLTLGGGMAVQQAVAERWKSLTKVPLLEAYGLTETSPGVAINPFELENYNGSIGLPLPSTEIAICDENDQQLGLNTPGELWVKGPQVMKGYWDKPEETAKIFTEKGWLRTGDIVTMDEQGYLYLVERKKDMILVSGFNVYPNEIENVIAAHPGVLEVGVVGASDKSSGEVVKAVIVKKDPNLTKEDIIKHCREHLTGCKIPRRVVFKESLPKTNVGKILRRELRDL